MLTWEAFQTLTEEEKQRLRMLMPEEDRTINKTFFGSKDFLDCMGHYTILLANGEYDPKLREYLKTQREEQQKNQDEWKRKHYESYWGELLNKKEE